MKKLSHQTVRSIILFVLLIIEVVLFILITQLSTSAL
jgi:hypothetical protein